MVMQIPANWQEWDGTGLPQEYTNSATYFAYGEIDLEDDSFMLRSLARSLKEDGVVDSISEGLELLEDAYVTAGTVMETDGERFPFYGDESEHPDAPMFTATWVEVNLDD